MIPARGTPHGFQQDGKSAGGTASGKNDPAAVFQCIKKGIGKDPVKIRSKEPLRHGQYIAVDLLESGNTGNGRMFEIILQRPAVDVRLFRRQKSEMELLFIIDKIACFFLWCHDPGFPYTFVFSDSLYHTTGYVFFKTGFPEKSIFRMQVQNHTLTNRMISAILYDYIYL